MGCIPFISVNIVSNHASMSITQRDFKLLHQSIVINVDFKQRKLSGFVDLKIVLTKDFLQRRSTSATQRFIGINLRNLNENGCIIHDISVDNTPTEWRSRQPYLQRPSTSKMSSIRDLQNFEVLFLLAIIHFHA